MIYVEQNKQIECDISVSIPISEKHKNNEGWTMIEFIVVRSNQVKLYFT